jgi:hypothetical protein
MPPRVGTIGAEVHPTSMPGVRDDGHHSAVLREHDDQLTGGLKDADRDPASLQALALLARDVLGDSAAADVMPLVCLGEHERKRLGAYSALPDPRQGVVGEADFIRCAGLHVGPSHEVRAGR